MLTCSVALTIGVSHAERASAQSAETATQSTQTEKPAAALGLDALLLARKNVEKYFAQAANVVCTESVSQSIVGKSGKAVYREESQYDYHVQEGSESGSLRLVESREARKVAFRDAARVLLITNGFANMLLIVHPEYETSYNFEPAGEESEDGVRLEKIRFKAIPGGASPAAFQLRGQNYPIPFNGTIWIDARTGAVTKLVAEVDASLADLGLQSLRSEIHYAVIQFHEPDEAYWMPVSATVDLATPKQHWRNVHRFSGYKRFRATMQVELGTKP